jgi:PDZ domain
MRPDAADSRRDDSCRSIARLVRVETLSVREVSNSAPAPATLRFPSCRFMLRLCPAVARIAVAAVVVVLAPERITAQAKVTATATARIEAEYSGGVATVPLVAGNRPAVDVMINGQGPFRMLVETGSGDSRLLPAAYAKIRTDTSASSSDSIRFGESVVRNLRIESIPQLPVPAVDGLIGLDAFANVTMTVDFPGRRLILSPDTLAAANDRDILRAERSVLFWAVSIALPTGSVLAILDTQNGGSLSAPPALALMQTFTTPPAVIGRARGPTIGDVQIQRARLSGSARIGDAVLEQPLLDLLPLPPMLPQDGYILGLQILNEFSVSLDQRTERMRFARKNRRVAPPPRVYALGISATPQPDGTRRVGMVIPESAAQDAAIAFGDIIIAVNDTPMAQIDDSRWRAMSTGARPLRLRIRRGMQELQITVTPRDMGF